MPCSGKRCVAAIDIALQGSQKQEALARKLCGFVDLIALIRNQIVLDQNDNLPAPSPETQGLATELIRQINSLGELYTETLSAANAQQFGLVCEINCRLLNVLIKRCVAVDNTGANYTLGNIANGTALYSLNYTVTPAEFLCCVSEHFARLQAFLERFAEAKRCEVPC